VVSVSAVCVFLLIHLYVFSVLFFMRLSYVSLFVGAVNRLHTFYCRKTIEYLMRTNQPSSWCCGRFICENFCDFVLIFFYSIPASSSAAAVTVNEASDTL